METIITPTNVIIAATISTSLISLFYCAKKINKTLRDVLENFDKFLDKLHGKKKTLFSVLIIISILLTLSGGYKSIKPLNDFSEQIKQAYAEGEKDIVKPTK